MARVENFDEAVHGRHGCAIAASVIEGCTTFPDTRHILLDLSPLYSHHTLSFWAMYKPRTGVEWAFLGVTATQAIGTSVLDM